MITSLPATTAFRPILLFSGFAFVRFPMFRHSRTKSAESSLCRHPASRSLGFRWYTNKPAEFVDRVPVLTKQSVKPVCFRPGHQRKQEVHA
jgi:hypothetical protein